MIEKLLHTDPDYAWTFLRIIAGLIIFPYGMQKLFGWFGGPGIGGTLKDGCAYSAFARWMGNELVWRKERGRD